MKKVKYVALLEDYGINKKFLYRLFVPVPADIKDEKVIYADHIAAQYSYFFGGPKITYLNYCDSEGNVIKRDRNIILISGQDVERAFELAGYEIES